MKLKLPLSRLCLSMAIGLSACSPNTGEDPKLVENEVQAEPAVEVQTQNQPNIIFILTDDQRYDAMGFMTPYLETPNMDRMAAEGVHFKNAFVSTALCSPSRASIMTGRYMHDHGIVDNNVGFEEGTVFFPQVLQNAGYQTAFIGKWHMGGHHDDPQPGFDHWISFKGQGNYLPTNANGQPHTLNMNGERIEQKGYITDELNGYAMDWLKTQNGQQPFFLYLSHKAVHADFIPAERHADQYSDVEMVAPETMANTEENYTGKPMWVKNQRNSWHGVDFPYHSDLDFLEYHRRYNQTLTAVDDGIGEIVAHLEAQGLLENTIVILMGDNGFMFGEHGLIDKRNAYEESMRVPLIAMGGPTAKGQVVDDVVANIDIAPTFLTLAGVTELSEDYDGISFNAQLIGEGTPEDWREAFLYEYYWEYNYPHTPTTFAIRTDRFKYIQYHGTWDTEELYDLQADPKETVNLVDDPEYLDVKVELRAELFAMLDKDGNGRPSVEFSERFGPGAVFRNREGSTAGKYPERWLRVDGDADVRRHTQNEGGKR